MSESIGVSFDGKGINMSVSFEKGVSTEVEFPQGGGKVDLSGVAQQGDDPEATNTAIYNVLNTFLSRSVKYDKQTGNLTIENVELIIE